MEIYPENTSTTRAVLSFLGGLAVGYGIALLFAPRAGHETRRMISDYAQSTGERISTAARGAMKSARQSAESAGERAGEYLDEARAKAKSVQHSGGSAIPQ